MDNADTELERGDESICDLFRGTSANEWLWRKFIYTDYLTRPKINLIRNDKILKVLTVAGNKNNLSELVNLMSNQIIETASDFKP